MADEVDYMSDEFLAQCVGTNDIRPGLIHSHSVKRQLDLEKKRSEDDANRKKKYRPTIEEVQKERLRDGMESALDTTNKGFEMLKKMGFKPGMSLGKEAEKGEGRKEPIAVNLKSDRVGLGWQQLIKQKKERIEQLRRERQSRKEEIFDPIKYREKLSNQHRLKMIESDLYKSQKICYNLDRKEGILEPYQYFFWPEYTYHNEDDSEEVGGEQEGNDTSYSDQPEYSEWEEVFEPADQLEILTSYLRDTYAYCVWCCTTFDGPQDMSDNCPGTTRADHGD